MTDYLAGRQTVGLGTDHAKLDALARYFGLDWLKADGANPLQIHWKSRDVLATDEPLNFGDAVKNFERVDSGWLERVSSIKTGEDGNRGGAIFELLGLNLFLSAGNKVVPSSSSSPGYDGVVELPDQSVLLVSIKNHGMTSYEKFFHKNAKELDDQFTGWLRRHAASGTELRILCRSPLDATRQDLMGILNGQLDGTANTLQIRSGCKIIFNNIDATGNNNTKRRALENTDRPGVPFGAPVLLRGCLRTPGSRARRAPPTT
jgi:hypothetical protein